ncbi:MAG TPA: 4Fe-4S dicluster domain-containing protein [Anaerolineae bacterium]|nr:4Fe-4S dicluster domain-containing protein [Anaerolineae bacterium]
METIMLTIKFVMFLVAMFSVLVGVWIVVGRGLFDTMRWLLRRRAATLGSFVDEVAAYPGGETLCACIQCGTCAGSCPAANEMQFSPRTINAMVKAGMRDEVLCSNSMWMCLSCYLCTERCPRGVQVTDIMYALKRLAICHNGDNYWAPAPVMERTFVDCVNLTGRLSEMGLTGGYYLRTNPVKALKMIPLGLKLLSHHRLPLIPSRIKGMQELRAMIRKVKTLEQERFMEPVPVATSTA